MAPFGCGDNEWTNYKPFYGGFEEIGLLDVGPVFEWLYEFGLDVLLEIKVNEATKKQIGRALLLNRLNFLWQKRYPLQTASATFLPQNFRVKC